MQHRVPAATCLLLAYLAAPFLGACTEASTQVAALEADAAGPAVLVSVEVTSPDGRNTYVGAYPELQTSAVDFAHMLEFGDSVSARTANGFVYVWDGEAATYTRYSVSPALELVAGPRVSFASFGVQGPALTHFLSPTRAYSMLSDAQALVVWNPSTMELLGDISTQPLLDADYPRVEYGEALAFGDYVAWPVLWSDYDNLRFKAELGVALVPVNGEEPMIVRKDGRCGAGWSLFGDDAGDLYAVGNGYFGFAHFFGARADDYPDDCVLRMPAGTTDFDPEYSRNLEQITGSPAVYHTWALPDHTLLAAVWDPLEDPKQLGSPDDYWQAPLLRSLVQIDDGVSTTLGSIPKSAVFSTLDYRLDDQLYVLESGAALDADGDAADARSALYQVSAGGVHKAFETEGQVAAIGRIR